MAPKPHPHRGHVSILETVRAGSIQCDTAMQDVQHHLLWTKSSGVAPCLHCLWGCFFFLLHLHFFAFLCIYLHRIVRSLKLHFFPAPCQGPPMPFNTVCKCISEGPRGLGRSHRPCPGGPKGAWGGGGGWGHSLYLPHHPHTSTGMSAPQISRTAGEGGPHSPTDGRVNIRPRGSRSGPHPHSPPPPPNAAGVVARNRTATPPVALQKDRSPAADAARTTRDVVSRVSATRGVGVRLFCPSVCPRFRCLCLWSRTSDLAVLLDQLRQPAARHHHRHGRRGRTAADVPGRGRSGALRDAAQRAVPARRPAQVCLLRRQGPGRLGH